MGALPSAIEHGNDVRGVLRTVDAHRIRGEVAWPRWIGSIPYDIVFASGARAWMDDAPATAPGRAGSNHAPYFARHDAVFEYDHQTGCGFIVGERRAGDELRTAVIDSIFDVEKHVAFRVAELSATSRDQHRASIESVLEHIRAGDIYQANIARTWSASFAGAPLELFCAMRSQSFVPFGFYQAQGASRAVLCRSMERYLMVDRTSGIVESRPIKGTIARPAHSDAVDLQAQLIADPKERAEHGMIVDLVRSDLARVSELATVHVANAFRAEPYRALFHLVSTIRGQLAVDVDLSRLIGATFPPGSVTGCPKSRALGIIDALEPTARDVYCGGVGYVSSNGDLDLAVAIRTAIVETARGTVTYRAGGGIVHRSDPTREVDETETKARVFLDAINPS